MENQGRKGKFELSVLGAVWMVILYTRIIPIFIGVPFRLIYEAIPFGNMENTKEIIEILGGGILRVIIVVLVLKSIKKSIDNNFEIKYFGKLNYKLLFSAMLLIGGYYLLYESSIGIVINKIPKSSIMEETFTKMFLNPYSAFISMAIIGPIFEEIFMRGIILAGLLNRYSPRKAIIASALIFGAWHLNIHQFVDATLAGLILGMIYYKTNSLILCIAAHMANNAIAVTMEYTEHSFNMITFFIGGLIFVGSTMLFFRYLKELNKNLKVDRSYRNEEVL